MGAEDAEGFCFHRKNECSAVMAVTEQKKRSYDELVRNEKSTHQHIEKQYPQRFSYCQSKWNYIVVRILNNIDSENLYKVSMDN